MAKRLRKKVLEGRIWAIEIRQQAQTIITTELRERIEALEKHTKLAKTGD